MRPAIVALTFLLPVLTAAHAATYTAASCNTADVQTAINSAARGDTVQIPAGTCTWTSGVTVSGKGIIIQGAGGGAIVAISSSTLALTTGSQSLTVSGTTIVCCTASLPTQQTPSFSTGEALNIYETGNSQNFLSGTVSSWNSGTEDLTVSVTSEGGTCGTGSSGNSPSNCARWLVATVPQTIIQNNSSGTLFSLTEDSTFNTRLEGIQIVAGTGSGDDIDIVGGGGAAIVVENIWIRLGSSSNVGIHAAVNRGVISNLSCDSTPFSQAPICIDPQPFDTTAWYTTGYYGMDDTGGTHNLYVETSNFHALLLASDNDEGARTVFRYDLFDNAGSGGHGADTGPIGSRKIEFYDNYGVYNGYSNLKTFPLNQWYYMRGGSGLFYQNVLPPMTSQDYGTKDTLNMTVMNLQRNAGELACWGSLASGTPTGANYPAPHQVGFGCTTTGCSTGSGGTGTTTYTPISGNPSYTVPLGSVSPPSYSTNPTGYGNQYVGDSEPVYIWGNSAAPLANVTTSDYGAGGCAGNNDSSTNYIVANRDYFNGTTAKPGYTPYTYPHPLVSSATAPAAPTPPQMLMGAVQ